MSLPRLIFVDGLPGSGKSTTAQRLSLHLRRQGHAARWIFEHESPHPLFSSSAVRDLREQKPTADSALFEHAMAGYAALADRLTTHPDEILVVEGSLFQSAVGTQILLDQPRVEIEAFFNRTLEILRPLNPALVHLAATDPVAALNRTAESRGPWFPEFVVSQVAATPFGQRQGVADWPGAVALLTEHHRMCEDLFARFPGPKLAIDPSSGTWDQHNAALTDFLQLPPLIEPPPPADLAQLAGTYRAEGAADTMEFAATPEGLFLAGPPPIRLWSRPEGGFELEGLAIELDFERDAPGRSVAVRCAPRIAELPLLWHRI